jgi:hypothetical protein
MSKRLEEIIKTFEVIERDSLIDDPDIKDLIRNMLSDEDGIVNLLVQAFTENMDDQKITSDVLKVIR